MRTILVACLVSLSFERPLQAAPPSAPGVEIFAAREAALDGLSDRDREIAAGLAAEGTIRYLTKMVAGDWGRVAYSLQVGQVLDANSFLDLKHQMKVTGISTADLVDGESVDASTIVFEVVGTETYETALGGTNTVRILKAIDTDAAFAAAVTLRGLKDFRVWHDDTGRFSVAAKFVEYTRGDVSIERLNGKVVKFPLKRLSKEDREYVTETVKAMAEAKKGELKRGRRGMGGSDAQW